MELARQRALSLKLILETNVSLREGFLDIFSFVMNYTTAVGSKTESP